MDRPDTDTARLIQKLSRRQWLVSLAVVAFALGSLFLGWRGIAEDQQSAEAINLAGRQRMLSQRMAMYLVLEQRETDQNRRRQYRDLVSDAASEFDQAHARLVAAAQTLGPGSPIHARYFGPTGSLDAESRRFLGLVRADIEGAALDATADKRNTAIIIAAAGNGLIKDLNDVTALFQRDAEARVLLMLRLLQTSTLLIVCLVALGLFLVFRPLVRRLADGVAGDEKLRRELQESEERFRAFSESSSDWFWQTDAEDRFTWVQEGKDAKAPLPLERVRGNTRKELRLEIELAAVAKWQAYQEDIDARRPFRDLEYQVATRDGGRCWISVSGQPFFDADGAFLGYGGTARYIQARKDIEASLQRLLLAIEQSPVSIMIIDADTRVLYVNAHFSAVSGYSADEAIGRRPKTLLGCSETSEATLADMVKILAEGKPWHGELCYAKKSGEHYWEKLSVSPVRDELGATTHYVTVSEDITAQRKIDQREQSRRQILEAIAEGAPLKDVLSLMVAMTEAEVPESICTILRLDRAQGRLFSACSPSLPEAFAEAIEGVSIGAEVGSCGAAAFTARRVVVEDIASHPYWRAWRDLAAAAGLAACWSQPILSSTGAVLGTLAVYYRTPRSPHPDEIQVIELVSSLAAICLERDEAQHALMQQEEQARRLLAENETILANAMVGVVYLKHRRVVSCNRRVEEIFGYGPGELIGKSSEVFYESHEAFEAIGEKAYRAVAEDGDYSTELILKHKDGSLFHGALTGRAIDPAHPQEGSIWVYADISERHHAEQKAHKLLRAVEQSPVSIVITNREGLIEYVNPRFTAVTGYTALEAMGQNPRILQSGETPLSTYQELWQALLAGKEWRGLLRNRRRNGELFWEEASISPIFDDTGTVTHYLAVKEDITERKRIEDELAQHRVHLEDLVKSRTADLTAALEAARAADKAKDAFLANVSHELRTPLNAVIGLADLARRISTDPRQREVLTKVANAGKSLAGIINDLLDLSKIAADRMELETTTFSLRALVQRSRSVIAHRATEKGLDLIERIDDEVPDVLLGDPLRIEQILMNLLSNAIKFTHAGHVRLHIGVEAREAARVRLRIDVEDTGIGLSEDSLARLFLPFAQADASMNRKFGGTGLGLALTRRLAEMMGGDISVSSREGVGSTFSVRLRLGLGNAADLPGAAPSAGAEKLPSSYRQAHVLVVDDQPLNREIVETLLDEVGITPRVACNGQEALDIVKAGGPGAFDLVLMDIQMPVVDGLEATREIRSWAGFGDLPIIAMTAHTMEHEKEISTAAGVNGHIGKPFETAHFYQLLAHWIPAAKQCLPAATTEPVPQPHATGLAALRSIDTQAGLARFVGNETRYRHWLAEFLGDAPHYAARISQLIAAGQPEVARQSAHAIKGRVGMLGMTSLHPIATALETALMQGAPVEALLDQLQAAVVALCTEIRAALGSAAPVADAEPTPGSPPTGPVPQSIAQLLVMLKCADGSSAEPLERCLAELKGTHWEPRLQQALSCVRNFDFDTAAKWLAPEVAERSQGT